MIGLLLNGVMMLITAGLFWYPSMESGYRPEPDRRKSWREKYCDKLNELFQKEDYARLERALSHPKLPPEEMPTHWWKQEIQKRKELLLKQAEQLKQLDGLEKLL